MVLRQTRTHGTTAPKERYYRDHLRYYRKGQWYYRSEEQYYRMPQNSNTRNSSFCTNTKKWRMLHSAKGKVMQRGVTCT